MHLVDFLVDAFFISTYMPMLNVAKFIKARPELIVECATMLFGDDLFGLATHYM